MATMIRLRRVGRKKQAHFRIVVTDGRTGPRSPAIERLGVYNPRTQPSLIKLDAARALYWLREGAEPSHSVRSLLRKTGVWEKWHAGVMPEELAPEEATVLQTPEGGRLTTSQRPKPDIAAEKREAAEAAKAAEVAAEAEPAAEPAVEAPPAEAAEPSEEETVEPEAVAAEAATEPEEVEAEEPVAEGAPAGTEATDEVREASAVSPEEEEEAAPEEPAEEETPEASAAEEEAPEASAEAEEAEDEEEAVEEDEEEEEERA